MDNQMNSIYETYLNDINGVETSSQEWGVSPNQTLGPIMPIEQDENTLSQEEISNLERLDELVMARFMTCTNLPLMKSMLNVNGRISATIFEMAGIDRRNGVTNIRGLYTNMIRLKRVMLCNMNHAKVVDIIMQTGGPNGEKGDLEYTTRCTYEQELDYLSMPLWMQTKYCDPKDPMNLFLFLEN
jgi:hypothetical protein